jgi:ribosomal protein S8E
MLISFYLQEIMLISGKYRVTVQLPIISVKKNPQNPMYTQVCQTTSLYLIRAMSLNFTFVE